MGSELERAPAVTPRLRCCTPEQPARLRPLGSSPDIASAVCTAQHVRKLIAARLLESPTAALAHWTGDGGGLGTCPPRAGRATGTYRGYVPYVPAYRHHGDSLRPWLRASRPTVARVHAHNHTCRYRYYFLNSILREFCGKSDAAFGGCGFLRGCAPPKRVIPGSVRGLW